MNVFQRYEMMTDEEMMEEKELPEGETCKGCVLYSECEKYFTPETDFKHCIQFPNQFLKKKRKGGK